MAGEFEVQGILFLGFLALKNMYNCYA